ncbi:hypothetical protein KFK09_004406 [Dendrobium nobile]|uniref:Uncharacterized protein n=1 Tax=Dendrobium nobile TaxID=94219 RepID=A0A8T3C0C4_DENNO|nr:hypothetical protein KFK09_004406 [Dendrobium nobile]
MEAQSSYTNAEDENEKKVETRIPLGSERNSVQSKLNCKSIESKYEAEKMNLVAKRSPFDHSSAFGCGRGNPLSLLFR